MAARAQWLVLWALVLAFSSGVAACAPGRAPSNLALKVANDMAATATVRWQAGGLFGTGLLASTGTDSAAGCQVYRRSFGAGHVVVTVELGSSSLTLTADVSEADQIERAVLIGSDGQIWEIDAGDVPLLCQ